MNYESKKGLKPFLIKNMALFMGICYLANPLHQQIGGLFHEISHVLQSPEAVASHPNGGHHDFEVHDHGNQKAGVHRLASTDHHHDLLDLIDAIFDASDAQNPDGQTALILIKWDKHIGSQHYIPRHLFPLTTSNNPSMVERKVKKGFLNLPKEPPQRTSV